MSVVTAAGVGTATTGVDAETTTGVAAVAAAEVGAVAAAGVGAATSTGVDAEASTGVGVLAAAGVGAVAAQDDRECAPPGESYQPVPWAQGLLAPERVWPFTRGGGVTVAVLATGVDAGHPQLSGRVRAGYDAVAGGGPADTDCAGTGTQVAGVIAANQVSGVGFVGLAPEVTVLPVRVVGGERSAPVEPAVLARGIRWAAENGAQVITVPVAVAADDTGLRAAVADALAAGVTVVAAVGGDNEGDATPYPAGYEGVVGAGAIDEQGALANPPLGDHVDLVAPGAGMVTLQRGGGLVVDVSSSGLAAGAVAATAALVGARWGDLAPDEVTQRLVATATPAAGPGFGHGVLNPYAAVTDTLPDGSPVPLPALARPAGGEPAAAGWARRVAVLGAGVAALVAVLVVALAVAVPRGRRRTWRSGVAAPPPDRYEPQEPTPPALLFDDAGPLPPRRP